MEFSTRAMRHGIAIGCLALGLMAPADAAHAQIYPLSNTPVAYTETSVFFDLGGGGLVGSADGSAGGVHVNSRVWRGREGTDAEGVYLYDYFVEDSGGGGPDLRFFGLPVIGLLAFDLDDDGLLDSSAYCSNCTLSPLPTPPGSAFLAAGGITWSFPSGITSGASATQLYFFADRGPRLLQGRVEFESAGLLPIDVLPEPASGALGALMSVAALRARSRGRRGRAGVRRASPYSSTHRPSRRIAAYIASGARSRSPGQAT